MSVLKVLSELSKTVPASAEICTPEHFLPSVCTGCWFSWYPRMAELRKHRPASFHSRSVGEVPQGSVQILLNLY